ncbi:hypothetical protein CLAFUR4_07525 [Fulvia fulva]|nr:hypothetical protein CLAFUR4_07525 [Fulvia fulva]
MPQSARFCPLPRHGINHLPPKHRAQFHHSGGLARCLREQDVEYGAPCRVQKNLHRRSKGKYHISKTLSQHPFTTFIVIFEATFPASKNAVAGAHCTKIAPFLSDQEGFIPETGFISPHNEEKHLTYAKCEGEAAAQRWRMNSEHLRIQHKARHGVFEDFRLRCGSDFTDQELLTPTEQSGQYMVVYEELMSDATKEGGLEASAIERLSISGATDIFNDASEITAYQGEKSIVWLMPFQSKEAAVKCMASQAFGKLQHTPDAVRLMRIMRDYGKSNRKEAPAGAGGSNCRVSRSSREFQATRGEEDVWDKALNFSLERQSHIPCPPQPRSESNDNQDLRDNTRSHQSSTDSQDVIRITLDLHWTTSVHSCPTPALEATVRQGPRIQATLRRFTQDMAPTDDEIDLLASEVKDYQITHGSLLKMVGYETESTVTARPVNVSLIPTPLPSKGFQTAKDLQSIFNELYVKVANDEDWLFETLGPLLEHDVFFAALWGVWLEFKKAGVVQPVVCGIFRSDYMLHAVEEDRALKQVEMNTFSVAGACHAERVAGMHRHLRRTGAGSQTSSPSGYLVRKDNTQSLVKILHQAHKAYTTPNTTPKQTCILMIVQPNNFNITDERPIEYSLWGRDTPCYRCEWQNILNRTTLSDDRTLHFHPQPSTPGSRIEVSVIYYRAGYQATEYDSSGLQARLRLESSRAIKCPDVLTHLTTFKAVQQASSHKTRCGGTVSVSREGRTSARDVHARAYFGDLRSQGASDEV